MKKFITLLCAVALTLGANAALSTKNLAVKQFNPTAKFAKQTMNHEHKAVAEIIAKDTVYPVINEVGGDVYPSTNDVQYILYANDGEYKIFVDLYTGGTDVVFDQTYTEDNLDPEYSGVKYVEDNSTIGIATLSFVKSQNGENYRLQINLLDSLGTRFIIDHTYQLPKVVKKDTIKAEDLILDASLVPLYEAYGYNYAVFEVSGGDNRIALQFYTNDDFEIEDDFVNEGFGGSNNFDGTIDSSNVYSGSITVSSDEDGYIVEGTVLCKNNVEYYIHLIYVKPEISRIVSLEVGGGTFEDLTSSAGAWQAIYKDDTIIVVMTTWADEIDGDYTLDDNYATGYTYFALINGKDTTWYRPFEASFSAEFDDEDSVVYINGSMSGQNEEVATEGVKLNFDMAFKLLVEEADPYEYDEDTDSWTSDFENGAIDDSYVGYGFLFVSAECADPAASISLQFVGTSLTAGTYQITVDGDDDTFLAGYIEEDYIYGSSIMTDDYEHIWYLVSGTVTVNADGSMTIAALNSNGISISGTITMAQTPVDNVNAEDVKAIKILRDGRIIIKNNNREFNVLGQQL